MIETWADEVEDRELLDEAVRGVVAEEFAGHLAAQAGWPAVTDNDRLSLAMGELAMAGIVAREHYTCCMSCGIAEMGREISGLSGVRGYVFYHGQDVERAVAGGGVYLAFGPGELGGEGERGPGGGFRGEGSAGPAVGSGERSLRCCGAGGCRSSGAGTTGSASR
ncbi:DUF6891 domain-containing protein [Nonomuraea rubra]|uniref:DUF6891 domain-containing protein n=1 Tax=Nonomuraea rubra TaxID=46180 RepID=UPI00361CBDDE